MVYNTIIITHYTAVLQSEHSFTQLSLILLPCILYPVDFFLWVHTKFGIDPIPVDVYVWDVREAGFAQEILLSDGTVISILLC